MKKRFIIVLCLLMVLMVSCATNTSVIRVPTDILEYSDSPNASKSVYVNSVVDNRVFHDNSDNPSDPTKIPVDEYEKDHAIGRKRNTYGKALGKYVLVEEQTVRNLCQGVIERALYDNGYKVIKDKKDILPDTVVVDVYVEQFWSWMNPGWAELKLNTHIISDVNSNISTPIRVQGSYTEGFAAATVENFKIVFQRAFDNFYKDAQEKLKDF